MNFNPSRSADLLFMAIQEDRLESAPSICGLRNLSYLHIFLRCKFAFAITNSFAHHPARRWI